MQTGHLDLFALRNLPPKELWPDLRFTLPEHDYPDWLNCGAELLDRHVAEGRGDRVALLGPGIRWTYAELLDKANRIARVLAEDLGVVPGNRVLLRGFNSVMLVACWFAVMKRGAIAVTTMPQLRAGELQIILGKAKVNAALCEQSLSGELDEAVPGNPALSGRVIHWDRPNSIGLEARMARKDGSFENCRTAATDVALIAFTSGTTGGPKGTMHFHRDVMVVADLIPSRLLKATEDDIFCGSPPLAFTFGLGALVLFPFKLGAASLLLEKAGPEALLAAIQDFRATACFTAPVAFRAMLGLLERYDISSLRISVSAGEHLPEATWRAWHAATGLRIIDGMGATEMLHIFISTEGDDIRPGATGRVMPGYEARIVDDEMRDLPDGTVGRLAVRGPTGCRYLADPRQTAYVRGGWNLTGDAFSRDEDGYFWYQSRTDDMIVSAGYNISGPEVEEALLAHAAVRECAVIGAPDAERGTIVKAFVVLEEGASLDAKTLQDFCKARIAPYKYPRSVEFVDELPRTESGKLQRYKLRDYARSVFAHPDPQFGPE
jgi:2-aminobenzoate-CoA ligase